MSNSRVLILTAALSYGWRQVAPFLLSLREAGFKGQVVLLVENRWLTAEDRRRFHEVDATLEPVYPLLSYLPKKPLRVRFKLARWMQPRAGSSGARGTWLNTWLHPIMSARFFFFRRLLKERFVDFDHIILSDARDVVFQSDPAAWQSPAALNLFSELEGRTVGGDPINAHWITHLFGAERLARIGSHQVSCAGVVQGTREGMLAYLEAMCSELTSLAAPIAGRNGYDQGVHNYLLATTRFHDSRVWPNGRGLAFHLEGLAPDAYSVDTAGWIRERHGRVPAMIHQYDRYPALIEVVNKRLGIAS